MKTLITLCSLLFFSNVLLAQQTLTSGEYVDALQLAYDNTSKKITGYYENSTGWDEEAKSPRFTCVFYIEGRVDGKKVKIKTYYPNDKAGDAIEGDLEIMNNKTISIKLPEEHGGCWNVNHFADEKPEVFELGKSFNWIQIRYVDTAKSYFYSEKLEAKKLKSYLIKGDIVCVEKIENGWAFCTYFGKKVTKRWLKIVDLNKL